MERKLIITSEQRVGSRWLHYSLAYLLEMDVIPEIGYNDLKKTHGIQYIENAWKESKIAKIHGATPELIRKRLFGIDYKIIGLVRNPRDRMVSLAFHKRYHPTYHKFHEKTKAKCDFEAVEMVVFHNEADFENNKKMLDYMLEDHSTQNPFNSSNYIWTAYEWMILDYKKELEQIVKFLGYDFPEEKIDETVEKFSFKSVTGRKRGEEKRDNAWVRKGVVGDWENWFTMPMIDRTNDIWTDYWAYIDYEERFGGKKHV